jgi:hypothetical protein
MFFDILIWLAHCSRSPVLRSRCAPMTSPAVGAGKLPMFHHRCAKIRWGVLRTFDRSRRSLLALFPPVHWSFGDHRPRDFGATPQKRRTSSKMSRPTARNWSPSDRPPECHCCSRHTPCAVAASTYPGRSPTHYGTRRCAYYSAAHARAEPSVRVAAGALL